MTFGPPRITRLEPAQRPTRPLMIFDGDCDFCRRWIARWRVLLGDHVDFEPYQLAAARFPTIPTDAFRRAVHLVEPDGRVTCAAEAVLRTLARRPGGRGWLWAYRFVPGVRAASEAAYRFVARHRDGCSRLTTVLWGRDLAPSTFHLSRWLFLRVLGLVFLIAFLSLRVQILGLVGQRGILPLGEYLAAARQQVGRDAYRLVPTLFWFDASDAAITLACDAGLVASALLLLGVLPPLALALAWVLYLSLVHAGQSFLSFQWDALLLETGFLAMLLAPARLLSRPSRDPAPPPAALFLLRWLLFRLMLLSGLVKLASGDPTWRDLTALSYHYFTQPLPVWTAWYAHHLPLWSHKLSAAGMFAIELLVPLLIFAPRRPRCACGVVLIGFQVLIAATGNYGFFNLLTVGLCLLLFDDAALRRCLPAKLAARLPRRAAAPPHRAWPGRVLAFVAAALFMLSALAGSVRLVSPRYFPDWGRTVLGWTSPFMCANGYGLFAVMTTQRDEIVIEGSNDGRLWREYAFRFKPGDVRRAPALVAPHQPRLDWQMWFAALSDYRRTHWFAGLMRRLLEGSPPVLRLLEHNPFPDAPPRFLRAMRYRYEFTDPKERRDSGAWWRRSFIGPYFPQVSRRAN